MHPSHSLLFVRKRDKILQLAATVVSCGVASCILSVVAQTSRPQVDLLPGTCSLQVCIDKPFWLSLHKNYAVVSPSDNTTYEHLNLHIYPVSSLHHTKTHSKPYPKPSSSINSTLLALLVFFITLPSRSRSSSLSFSCSLAFPGFPVQQQLLCSCQAVYSLH